MSLQRTRVLEATCRFADGPWQTAKNDPASHGKVGLRLV